MFVAIAQSQGRVVIEDRFASIGDVKLHYLVAGKGEPVILLHGYAQNSRMWRPLMAELARTRLVIAPDLRGFGQSSKPATGYEKKTMAQDIHGLATSLRISRASVVGHDIGLMVAYAYAAQYSNEVDRIVLMDAFLPGVGDWQNVWLLRDLWHFHFYGVTPLKLVTAANEFISNIFGMTSPRIQSTRYPKPIEGFTPWRMHNPGR
jgi:pimeloyl-ACP methyl ester carboxylesterase